MRDATTFGADTTASEVSEGIDLRGKVALVTGGSGGIGQETARALAERGAHVILTARDLPKGEAVAAGIRESTGNPKVEVAELELGSLQQIRAFADRFLARHPALHIMVDNAGVMACPPMKTADGFELQFGSNHLGHFLATCLLVPALRAAAPSRVVSVSSRGHRMSPVVFRGHPVRAPACLQTCARCADRRLQRRCLARRDFRRLTRRSACYVRSSQSAEIERPYSPTTERTRTPSRSTCAPCRSSWAISPKR